MVSAAMIVLFAHAFSPSDIDIPPGWASVIVAVLVGGVGGVGGLSTFMNRRLRRVWRDVKATRDQVANNHVDENGEPILMRDENDERHAETMRALNRIQAVQSSHAQDIRRIERKVDSQGDDIGGIRSDIRQLHRDDAAQLDLIHHNSARMTDIEHTIPRDELGRFTKRKEIEE